MSAIRRKDVSTDELVEAYATGVSLEELGRRVEMSRGGVKKRLIRAGVTIRSNKSLVGPKNGRWSANPSSNAGRLRANKIFAQPEPCSECGTDWRPTRHHIDHDPTNNAPENIKWLCARCHSSHHAKDRVSRGIGLRGWR